MSTYMFNSHKAFMFTARYIHIWKHTLLENYWKSPVLTLLKSYSDIQKGWVRNQEKGKDILGAVSSMGVFLKLSNIQNGL